ncbi:MAG TPA: pirin family protein [Isosphaeraceae bacterium]|jgi:hypothetical protein|nr:pirin family protein [Isosphaeraceae bacterium]
MIRVRRGEDRGGFDHGWLETRHTFSFGDYYDPAQMGFRSLRVMNEDWIKPGAGFGMHPHRDMEIVTYVLSGALAHRDSTGGAGVIGAGELQRMTAGTGIRHSEFNASAEEPVHLYQIWLLPERPGLTPGYDQRAFPESERRNRFQVVAAPDGADGALTIRQDARLALASLVEGAAVSHPIAPGRHAWVQVLRGSVNLDGHSLQAGDGAAVSDEPSLEIAAREDSEVLLFDLA